MLGRAVVEGQQHITILIQTFSGRLVLQLIALDEFAKRSLGVSLHLAEYWIPDFAGDDTARRP